MNQTSAPTREPQPVEAIPVDGGFRARFRKATGGWDLVREGSVPRIFETEHEARLAAWEARDKHFCGHGILSVASEKARLKAEAEKIFPRPGKMVEVVRR